MDWPAFVSLALLVECGAGLLQDLLWGVAKGHDTADKVAVVCETGVTVVNGVTGEMRARPLILERRRKIQLRADVTDAGG